MGWLAPLIPAIGGAGLTAAGGPGLALGAFGGLKGIASIATLGSGLLSFLGGMQSASIAEQSAKVAEAEAAADMQRESEAARKRFHRIGGTQRSQALALGGVTLSGSLDAIARDTLAETFAHLEDIRISGARRMRTSRFRGQVAARGHRLSALGSLFDTASSLATRWM